MNTLQRELIMAAATERARRRSQYKVKVILQAPGTELHKLLAECGIMGFAGCGCSGRIRQMNAGGIEWCKANQSTIIGWLREAACKLPFNKKRAALKALRQQPWWSRLEPFASILGEALRRAEANQRAAVAKP